MGLGLTISRDLVHAFGGTISIDSEVTKGTDFVINLSTKSNIDKKEHTKFFKKYVPFVTLGNKQNKIN